MPSSHRARHPPPPLSFAASIRPRLFTARSAPEAAPSIEPPTPAHSFTDVLPVGAAPDPAKKSHSAARSPTHTKRPPNSWILYRSDTLRNISQAKTEGREFIVPEAVRVHPRWEELGEGGTGMPKAQSKASKLISLMWSLESRAVRESFERLSELRKIEHARLFPGYKFQPRKSVSGVASTPTSSTTPSSRAAMTTRTFARRRPAPIPFRSSTYPQTSTAPTSPPVACSYAVHGETADTQDTWPGPIRSEKRSRAKRKKQRSSEASTSLSARSQTPLPAAATLPYDAYVPYSIYPPSSAASVGGDISWAMPPTADAPAASWHGYQQSQIAFTATGRTKVVGLGIWPAEQAQSRSGKESVRANGEYAYRPFHEMNGPSSNHVSPALTSDSFDSHPTPAVTYAPLLRPVDQAIAHNHSSPSDENSSIHYAEYEYTSAPWPNPIEGGDIYHQRSTTILCGIGPAEFVKNQYYEQPAPPPPPPVHSNGHIVTGWAFDEPPDALLTPLPSWDDAALIASGGRGPIDSHGLAAMWCLLDDDGGGGSTTISPISLDTGLSTNGNDGYGTERFSFDVDSWATPAGANLSTGLEGDWGVDYSVPGPMKQTLSALASDFGTGVIVEPNHENDVEGSAVSGQPLAGHETGRSFVSGATWSGSDRPASDQSGHLPAGDRDHPSAPPVPQEFAHSTADPALVVVENPRPLSATATTAADIEAVTRDVGRVTVGVPRRNTRVVGGSFNKPPRLPPSPPTVDGRV